MKQSLLTKDKDIFLIEMSWVEKLDVTVIRDYLMGFSDYLLESKYEIVLMKDPLYWFIELESSLTF